MQKKDLAALVLAGGLFAAAAGVAGAFERGANDNAADGLAIAESHADPGGANLGTELHETISTDAGRGNGEEFVVGGSDPGNSGFPGGVGLPGRTNQGGG